MRCHNCCNICNKKAVSKYPAIRHITKSIKCIAEKRNQQKDRQHNKFHFQIQILFTDGTATTQISANTQYPIASPYWSPVKTTAR